MEEVAELICLAIKDFEGNRSAIEARVAALCERFPIYQ
jgi:glycine/serine hydroxymethyltransferase